MKKTILSASLCMGMLVLQAQKATPVAASLKDEVIQQIDGKYDTYKNIAQQIWGFAEVGYKEVKSAQLLQETLKNNGFTVQTGVAEMPTAFVASYGSGKPVIAILAEYDALPGLSQEATPEKKPMAGLNSGHGC